MKIPAPLKQALFISSTIMFLLFLTFILSNYKIEKDNYYIDYALLTNNNNDDTEEVLEIIEDNNKIEIKKESTYLGAHLLIPKLKINVMLGEVALTAQNTVDVPNKPWLPAWFNLGPAPGEIGNAVIVGHSGLWKNGEKTIFNNLSNLIIGDKIYIKDKEGKTKVFIVYKLLSYQQEDNVPEVFYSENDRANLNLITCAGIWDEISQSYPERLVVFTSLE